MQRRKISFVLLVLLVALFFGGGDTKAETLDIICNSSLGSPIVSLGHVNGTTEGYDNGYDAAFLESFPPCIDFYSKTSLPSPYDKLILNWKGANSTTNFLVEIRGRGLSETKQVDLDFSVWDDGQANFEWKNLIVELYNAGDINDPCNLLGTFDAYDLANGNIPFPQLSVNNGLSYQLLIKPRNYADLNLSQRVNWADFPMLASSWLTSGHDANDVLAEYSDINRSGTVDVNDLRIFSDEWLWDG